MDCRQAFLRLAAPQHRAVVEDTLKVAGDDWAALQQAFLARIDAYVEEELARPSDYLISSHEAGGAWRIAFPHYHARGDARLPAHMAQVMRERRAYAERTFYHGFPDEAEVHHEIETFIYFQMPMVYLGLVGSDVALAAVEDVAHHTGNWAPGVPDWYDWDAHGFRSTWLGTRNVRAHPPYDYQEANHFRFLAAALATYRETGQERYLQLGADYGDRWCAHIEARAAAGGPVTCAILPPGAASEELGHAGKPTDTSRYQTFYSAVAPNTAYEVSGGLLDLFRLTGNERYLTCSQLMLDQFFANGEGGRPALRYQDGRWASERAERGGDEFTVRTAVSQTGAMLARPALRHDLIAGQPRYRDRVLAWARAVDEQVHPDDQMKADVLLAAHYYTGDSSWLARAYAMGLRTWAVAEQDPTTHMCNSAGRYGSKFLMELCYQPLLGGVDWGTRAGLPVERLQHETEGRHGLPEGLAFRIWCEDETVEGFEAINCGPTAAAWVLSAAADAERLEVVQVAGEPAPAKAHGFLLRVDPGQRIIGRIHRGGGRRPTVDSRTPTGRVAESARRVAPADGRL